MTGILKRILLIDAFCVPSFEDAPKPITLAITPTLAPVSALSVIETVKSKSIFEIE